jgi:hypothetical protein
MKKVAPILVAALALMVIFRGMAFAHDGMVTLTEQNGSGQNGMATLTDMGNGMTMVTLEISNGTTTPQPAHIHAGTCANLDPKPAYPLSSVVNGKSETMVDADVDDLLAGDYAINVHKSPTEASIYVSCGNIVESADSAPGMPRTGNSDQMFTLAALGILALSITGVGLRLKLARRKA